MLIAFLSSPGVSPVSPTVQCAQPNTVGLSVWPGLQRIAPVLLLDVAITYIVYGRTACNAEK